MVMKAYDVSVDGYQYGSDNTSSARVVYMSKRDILSNISSTKNAKPYRAYSVHGYLKRSIRKLAGRSFYTGLAPGSYHLSWSGTSPDYSAQTSFDPLATQRSTALTDSYNKALSKLNDRIRGNTDLSVDSLQGGQTMKMIRDIGSIIRYTSQVRRNPALLVHSLSRLTKRKVITGTGDAWLAYVYGIKPLMSSIYDAAVHQSHHYNNEFSFSKARGTSSFYGRADNTGAQWPDYTYTTSWEGKGTSRAEIGVIMRIPDTPLTNVARLSSLNPVSMAWELMPWSFVVDWFYDIGGYLRNLETALAYSSYFVRGYRTYTSLTAYEFYGHRYIVTPTEFWSGDWGIHIERRELSRIPLSSYPMPSRPVFQCNLGSGRLLNAAALLTQFLKPISKMKISASGGGSAYQRGSLGFAG